MTTYLVRHWRRTAAFALLLGQAAAASTQFVLTPPALGTSAISSFQRVRSEVQAKLRELEHCTQCTAEDKKINVLIQSGDYFFDTTFILSEPDSAPSGGSVTWTAAPGARVRFLGAKPVSGFVAASNLDVALTADQKTHLKMLDLNSLGIKAGQMKPLGFRLPSYPFQSELFQNGRPLALSRFPESGWLSIRHTKDNSTFSVSEYTAFNPQANSAWFYGYWGNDFSYQYIQVNPDLSKQENFTLFAPFPFYPMHPGSRVALLNTIEYLRAPGQYVVDKHNRLLLWPPKNDPNLEQEYLFSVTSVPLLELRNVSGVTFHGMEWSATRGVAVVINGGHDNSLSHCLIHNTGQEGVRLSGGMHNSVLESQLYDTGNEAIVAGGGNRKTLEASKHWISNNIMERFGRIGRTYHPAIELSGVGVTVSHNEISHGPHFAIGFWGNNHTIEYNHVHNVVEETSDAGAFYIGRDWSMRGNKIRYNYIHDLGKEHLSGPGAMGIYLDDLASGTSIFGNLFYRAGRAVFIGGGRDNTVTNNIFLACEDSFHLDDRGKFWNSEHDWFFKDGLAMVPKLESVDYKSSTYESAYPGISKILNKNPLAPLGNEFSTNLLVSSKTDLEGSYRPKIINNINASGDPVQLSTPAAFMEYVQKSGFKLPNGFNDIPAQSIGLQKKR